MSDSGRWLGAGAAYESITAAQPDRVNHPTTPFCALPPPLDEGGEPVTQRGVTTPATAHTPH